MWVSLERQLSCKTLRYVAGDIRRASTACADTGLHISPREIWKHREVVLTLKEKRELWTQFRLGDCCWVTIANLY